jgi:8-oxo-dGTP pyrophosphatase MutT (NUDIX family)
MVCPCFILWRCLLPFSMLPDAVQREIEQLVQRYGQPLTPTVTLQTKTGKRFDPLSKSDRYGEVCMVVRRRSGRLLTMTKSYYPQHAYRLPTGGINHGEAIFDALLRETHEETSLQVAVRRFLVASTYTLETDPQQPVFYTFAFLLDEIGGDLSTIDESEDISDFREISPGELPELAEQLANLGQQNADGEWHDWGLFRSFIHRHVWEAMRS